MPDVQLSVGANDDGASDVIRAVIQSLQALRQEVALGNTSAASFNEAHLKTQQGLKTTGAVAKEAKDHAAEFGDALTTLGRRAAEAFGLYELANAMRSFVARGVEFNALIESVTAGIAGLVVAETTLTDASGRQLEGTAKLNAAYAVAQDQIAKLRVGALATTATTAQLVETYRSLAGAGQVAGLSLDQVRTITIQAAQAARTLGIPFELVNQEVRQIFAGQIRVGDQLAKDLGLTTEQVELAKEQGTLADLLTHKLSAFTATSRAAALNFEQIKARLRDTLSLVAGGTSEGLFDTLKAIGNSLVASLIDPLTGGLAARFAPLIEEVSDLGRRGGAVLKDAVAGAVHEAEALAQFVDRDRTEITEAADAAVELARVFGHVLATLTAITRGAVQFGLESGLIAGFLRSAADVLRAIAGLLPDIVAAFVAIRTTTAVIAAANGGLVTLSTVVAALGGPVTVLVGALTALLVVWNSVQVARDRELATTVRHTETQAEAATGAQVLTNQYRLLSAEIARGTLTGGALHEAQDKLKQVTADLVKLGPDYARVLETQGQSAADTRRQLEQLTQARVNDQAAQLTQLKAQLAGIDRQIRAKTAGRGVGFTNASTVAELGAQADALQQRINAIQLGLKAASEQIVADTYNAGVTVTTHAAELSDRARARALRELTELAATATRTAQETVKDQEAVVAELHRQGAVSASQYYNALTEHRQRAIDVEIAGQRRLLAAETDDAQRAVIGSRIAQLEHERTRVAVENANKRAEAERREADEVEQARRHLLALTGREGEAAILDIQDKYRLLLARLEVEGNTRGVAVVKALLSAEVAKTQMDAIATAVTAAESDLKSRLDAINVEVASGALTHVQGQQAISEAYETTRIALVGYLDQLQQIEANTPSRATAAKIDVVRAKIGELGKEAAKTSDGFKSVVTKAQGALEGDLARFLDQSVDKVHSLGDAFRSLAASVVQSLRQIVSQMLANIVVAQLFKAIVGGGTASAGFAEGGAVGGSVAGGFAGGGPVRGPGTSTSDSIPALLSAGEYVVRASAVRAYGQQLFYALNGARLPAVRGRSIVRLAYGGLVSAAPAGGARGAESRLLVGLEAGLVTRHLESDEGQRATVRTIVANRIAVKRALGLA